MTVPPVLDAAGVAHWTCDGCGRYSTWTDEHAWYGSWADVEGGGKTIHSRGRAPWVNVVVSCSRNCTVKLVIEGRVPAVADDGSRAIA